MHCGVVEGWGWRGGEGGGVVTSESFRTLQHEGSDMDLD